MIFGIGIDIVETARFKKWIYNPNMISRFFNKKEMYSGPHDPAHEGAACQHYAARFAAKEAFSKALGTGISGFELSDVFIEKKSSGKPELRVENSARKLLETRCRNANILVTLSHEKSCAVACVIIEIEKNL